MRLKAVVRHLLRMCLIFYGTLTVQTMVNVPNRYGHSDTRCVIAVLKALSEHVCLNRKAQILEDLGLRATYESLDKVLSNPVARLS